MQARKWAIDSSEHSGAGDIQQPGTGPKCMVPATKFSTLLRPSSPSVMVAIKLGNIQIVGTSAFGWLVWQKIIKSLNPNLSIGSIN